MKKYDYRKTIILDGLICLDPYDLEVARYVGTNNTRNYLLVFPYSDISLNSLDTGSICLIEHLRSRKCDINLCPGVGIG